MNILRTLSGVAAVTIFGVGSASAACLTNPSDAVGAAAFGATVQTFINAGITPGNGTGGTACIENALWATPSNFGLGTYVKGADAFGTGLDNTTLGSYDGSGSLAGNTNGLDHAWVQDIGNQVSFGAGGIGGEPSQGIVWDLGGQANQVAVYVFVDHGPVPEEVLENTAWLSNDPNAVDAGWTQAQLVHVYGFGWDADPVISDGFVAVYQLPSAATFRVPSTLTRSAPASSASAPSTSVQAAAWRTRPGA